MSRQGSRSCAGSRPERDNFPRPFFFPPSVGLVTRCAPRSRFAAGGVRAFFAAYSPRSLLARTSFSASRSRAGCCNALVPPGSTSSRDANGCSSRAWDMAGFCPHCSPATARSASSASTRVRACSTKLRHTPGARGSLSLASSSCTPGFRNGDRRLARSTPARPTFFSIASRGRSSPPLSRVSPRRPRRERRGRSRTSPCRPAGGRGNARAAHTPMYAFFRVAARLPARRPTPPDELPAAHGFADGGRLTTACCRRIGGGGRQRRDVALDVAKAGLVAAVVGTRRKRASTESHRVHFGEQQRPPTLRWLAVAAAGELPREHGAFARQSRAERVRFRLASETLIGERQRATTRDRGADEGFGRGVGRRGSPRELAPAPRDRRSHGPQEAATIHARTLSPQPPRRKRRLSARRPRRLFSRRAYRPRGNRPATARGG